MLSEFLPKKKIKNESGPKIKNVLLKAILIDISFSNITLVKNGTTVGPRLKPTIFIIKTYNPEMEPL